MARINSAGSPDTSGDSGGTTHRRTEQALLRTTSEVLRSLKYGLEGFTPNKFGPCHLILSNGSKVKVSAVDTVVAPRFECFSLSVNADDIEIEPSRPFASPVGDTRAYVLIRDEYIQPYDGDAEGLVGSAPRTIQKAAMPGRIPANALMSCQVAYGLLIDGINGRLVVAADWFPFKVETTTDQEQISGLLGESEVVPVEDYVERFRVSG